MGCSKKTPEGHGAAGVLNALAGILRATCLGEVHGSPSKTLEIVIGSLMEPREINTLS